MNSLKRRLILLCIGISIIFLVRQYRLIEDYTFSGETMGTTFSIVISHIHPESGEFETWKKDITGLLDNINRSMSDYIKDSEISRFNNNRDIDVYQQITKDFYTVLSESLEIYRESNGYFDITVSPLVNLWGFGPDGIQNPPNESDIKYILSIIGSDKIVLGKNQTIAKTNPLLRINVNAIAKGFAVDKIAEYLINKKSENFMVEIGGEIFSRGRNRKGEPWRIGIDTPDSGLAPGEVIHAVVELQNRGMATSGDYRQYIEKDNTRYSHIIDPKTGYPVTHNLTSVTVIADTCMKADAYATTLFVMGMEKGIEWLNNKKGIEAYFITKNKDGSFYTSATKGFKIL